MRSLVLAVVIMAWCPVALGAPGDGYLYATATDGWRAQYGIELADTLSSGTRGFVILGGVTTALIPIVSPGGYVSLHLNGGADLGDLGRLEWRTRGARLLPGNPSPTVQTLGSLQGILAGMAFSDGYEDFSGNAIFTTGYVAVPGGQRLDSLRVDFGQGPRAMPVGFRTGGPPATDNPPVAVPEPGTLVLLLVGVAGVAWAGWRKL